MPVRQLSPDIPSGAGPTVVAEVWWPRTPPSHGLIIRLIIQSIRRDRAGSVWSDGGVNGSGRGRPGGGRRERSGSVWIDGALNVSRPDRSGADQIDAEHQATELAVGGSYPSRRATKPQVNGLGLIALLVSPVVRWRSRTA